MKLRARLAMLALASALALSAAQPALPCGAFVARHVKTVPSLQVEQTLIVFDADKQVEHFVRQVAIRDPSPGFGFVVPVPEKPEVARVKESPFEKLSKVFPVSSGLSLAPGGRGGGLGKVGSGAAASVTVLSRERIGSFTAFVLAASDAEALRKWLSDNQLVVPAEAAAWFEHYVALRFYYVALRYEQPAKPESDANTRAETLRITFPTPLPFYPYREPDHAGAPPDRSNLMPDQATPAPERDLAVWLVSNRRYVPVSFRDTPSERGWQRPWLEHSNEVVERARVAELLDATVAALLPGPDKVTIQVFEDQKTRRTGFGDVVLVPDAGAPSTPLDWAKASKLMATLDPDYREGR
jgi:hypothetical protein